MSMGTLEKKLRKRFPDLVSEIDKPEGSAGSWFLNASLKGHSVVVEWRKGVGFGISCRPDIGFGEGPDEVLESDEQAFQRIVSLLLSRTKTTPPREVRLRELRELVGMSQTELANRLNIQQASISKLEQGRDMHLSTLKSLIEAMGGQLSLVARFPDGDSKVISIQELIGSTQSN